MGAVNKVFLMGNLTRDPEVRYLPAGTAVCEFGMAVNRKYQTKDGQKHDDTCFVDVTMWGKRGAVIAEYFKKGDPIYVEGRLNYDSWDDKQTGKKRSKLTVVAENFEFLGGKGEGVSKGRQIPTSAEESAQDVAEEDIPF